VTDSCYRITLIASFHSLMSAKISLFLKIYSLFRISGDSGRKHRWLAEFSRLGASQITAKCAAAQQWLCGHVPYNPLRQIGSDALQY
jgi:hypothetical protein